MDDDDHYNEEDDDEEDDDEKEPTVPKGSVIERSGLEPWYFDTTSARYDYFVFNYDEPIAELFYYYLDFCTSAEVLKFSPSNRAAANGEFYEYYIQIKKDSVGDIIEFLLKDPCLVPYLYTYYIENTTISSADEKILKRIMRNFGKRENC